ncbi:MAG: hypothetical protein ACI9SP_004596 [Arenicella sp.]
MEISKITIAILLSLLLVGCGAKSGEENEGTQIKIIEHQLEALEKAKAVEKTVLDTEAKRKSELEKLGI